MKRLLFQSIALAGLLTLASVAQAALCSSCAYITGNNTIYSWEPTANAVVTVVTAPEGPLDSLIFDKDRNIIFNSEASGRVYLYNTTTMVTSVLVNLGAAAGAGDMALEPSGDSILIAGRYDQKIYRLHLTTKALSVLYSGLRPDGIIYDTTGKLYAVLGQRLLAQLDPATGAILKQVNNVNGGDGLTFSTTTAKFYVGSNNGGFYTIPNDLSSAVFTGLAGNPIIDGVGTAGHFLYLIHWGDCQASGCGNGIQYNLSTNQVTRTSQAIDEADDIAPLSGLGSQAPPPAPVLASLVPNTKVAGSAAFTLTLNGSNFASGSTVTWNGSDRTTVFVNNGQLTASISAADVASAGTVNVRVRNTDAQLSNALPFTITPVVNPAPTLGSLVPNTAVAGGPAFTLAVNGSNFINGAVVTWNGVDRPTTFGSGSQLTASISAADIASAGTTSVRVRNPDNQTSGPLTFTITNAAPSLSSLSPSSAVAGSPAFTLTVNGSNFVSGAVVTWNGSNRTTSFVNSGQLTVSIPPTDIASAGSASVRVRNPDNQTSGPLTFTITPASSPAPVLGSMTPNTAVAGSPAFTLTVNGSNFVSGAVVTWNGSNRTTSFVNSGQLTVSIPATDIASAGTANVQVKNPDNQTSSTLPFTISAPPVSQLQFNPTSYSVREGDGKAVIVVTRTGSTSGTSSVRFASADGTATAGLDYRSVSGTLTFGVGQSSNTFEVPVLSDRLTENNETVTLSLSQVTGGTLGTSQAVLTIQDSTPPPPPTPNPFISELVPYYAPVGYTQPFSLRVKGTDFDANGAQVIWNNTTSLTVVSRSTTEINVTINPTIWNNTVGLYPILVRNPGNKDSNSALFTVWQPGIGSHPPFVVQEPKANPNPTYTKTTNLTVLGGTFNPGGESVLIYDWEPVGAQPGTFSFSSDKTNAAKNITATFGKPGTYRFRVTITDPASGFSVDTNSVDVVVIAKATTLTLGPKTQTITPDQTAQFFVNVRDQFGTLMNLPLTWTHSSGSLAPNQASAVLAVDMTIRSVHVTAALTDNSLSDFADVSVIVGSGGVGRLVDPIAAPVPYKSNSGLPGVTFKRLAPGTGIRLYSTDGRLVQTLVSNDGNDVLWDLKNSAGSRVASGVYFYVIELGDQRVHGKLVLIL